MYHNQMFLQLGETKHLRENYKLNMLQGARVACIRTSIFLRALNLLCTGFAFSGITVDSISMSISFTRLRPTDSLKEKED